MPQVLIVTHGNLGRELVAAAETIVGRSLDFHLLTLDWQATFEQASEAARDALGQLDADAGVLVLTDIYGGTPYNVAAALHEPGRVELVTGVNLPMVVRLGCLGADERPVGELAEWIRGKGRDSICCCGEGEELCRSHG